MSKASNAAGSVFLESIATRLLRFIHTNSATSSVTRNARAPQSPPIRALFELRRFQMMSDHEKCRSHLLPDVPSELFAMSVAALDDNFQQSLECVISQRYAPCLYDIRTSVIDYESPVTELTVRKFQGMLPVA